MRRSFALPCLLASIVLAPSCSSDPAPGTTEATASFDFGADLATPEHFFDAPYPSDLRLRNGAPDVRGYPMAELVKRTMEPVRTIAGERKGFPTLAVAYFRFDRPIASHDIANVIPAAITSPIVLVDIDPGPTHGELTPLVATVPPPDDYVPDHLLAVAPRQGFILRPKRKYAVVVFRDYNDAAGKPLAQPKALKDVLAGGGSAEAKALHAPLIATLGENKVDLGRVAAATVFTTGDVVDDTFQLSERVKRKYSVSVEGIKVDPDDGAAHPGYCELVATVSLPQFQRGTPPFNTDGFFELDESGIPKEQRREVSPLTIAIPKGTVPDKGLPLVIYFHGSGGVGREVVDASAITAKGQEDGPKGEGPASFLAPHGIAAAGMSLPFSTDRFPNASEQEYLNFSNPAAMRDTFRQGVLEQRMLLEALRTLRIPKTALGACTGVTVTGEDFGFDEKSLFAMGQSMGGMYTNFLSSVEPRIRAAVPTGAGGFWTNFILETSLIPNVRRGIGLLVGTRELLTFLHPSLSLIETAWEPIDPIVYAGRVARRPLPNHPQRHIYEPVGKGDRYFPTTTYDAMALSYGHRQAGQITWDTMQPALALQKLDGILPYPVSQNLTSETNQPYTGVIVQYEGDGIGDPHGIYRQLDAVKYQYGCFLSTLLTRGTPTVPAPQPLGTPCP